MKLIFFFSFLLVLQRRKKKNIPQFINLKNRITEVELPDRWGKNCRIICKCQLEIFGTILFPADTKCLNWRTKLNSKGLKKDWRFLSEELDGENICDKIIWLNMCKRETVFTWEMLILFSLAGRDRDAYNNRIYKQNAINFYFGRGAFYYPGSGTN